MKLRCFKNQTELIDGRILEMSQVYKYWHASYSYPEEWDGEEPSFRIDGESVSREEVLAEISIEEFEKFVDSAIEDTNWSPPRVDESDYL